MSQSINVLLLFTDVLNITPPPPVNNKFKLQSGEDFLLQDGTNFLLQE